ncbi:MAG: DNA polymerase III subunit delta [Myxococcaceae bacterium]
MAVELEDAIKEAEKGGEAPLYLLWGEEFLVRAAADELVKRLVPDASMGLNYSVLDGASPREVAEDLATLPLFPGRKVVLLRDPEFLAPKKGRGDALGKAREAWKSGRRKEGARRLLALVSRAGWGAGDLDPGAEGAPGPEQWKEELNVELASADLAFLKEAAEFCREEKLSAPEGDDSALIGLLEKGLPKGQVLVIAASEVDPKSPLVKFAKQKGRLIERKVASRLKELDLGDLVAKALAPHKKRLSASAAELLKRRCGGNMRLAQSELEKLALYTDGPVIQEADVELLVAHAREDQYFELSEALQKRDLHAALDYVEETTGQGTHPLMLLGSIASVVRTVLTNHERLSKLSGGRPPRSMADFEARVFPAIEAEAKAAKTKVPHPYGAYMSMQAATRFSRNELLGALVACADADLALKLGGGRLVVERLLWTVCGAAVRPESPVPSSL